MVSKKQTSPYRSGYTKAWLKVKTFLESEFVVVGYDTTPGGVRSLLVAREQDGQMMYAGRVMVTLRGPKRKRSGHSWRSTEPTSPRSPNCSMVGRWNGSRLECVFASGTFVARRHCAMQRCSDWLVDSCQRYGLA